MIRNPWKGVFVLLAILAPVIAGHGFAQENNGSPDGLYAVPDAGESASSVNDSTSERSAESYLNSLDSQGQQFKRNMEKAEATAKAAASAKRLRYLVAGGDSNWSAWRPNLSEQNWIATLGGVGAILSLVTGGYVWWSRAQYAKANRAVLLAMKREPAAKADGTEQHGKPSTRRAA